MGDGGSRGIGTDGPESRQKSLWGVMTASLVGNRGRTAVGGGRDREGCSLPNGIRTGPVTNDVVADSRDQPHQRAHSTNAGTVTTTHGLPTRIAHNARAGPVPSTCEAAQPPKPLTTLCLVEVSLHNAPSYHCLPTPRDAIARLLHSADITLPKVFSLSGTQVSTKKKLQSERLGL